MFFAALLAITLVPALGTLLIRGKIRPEEKHPDQPFPPRDLYPNLEFHSALSEELHLCELFAGTVHGTGIHAARIGVYASFE